jgi:regulator of sigma E protease
MQHVLVAILSFVIALGILVLVHEFGHFLAAKLCGVRVEQFSIGFPPRLFGFKIGETDYCISATPLGGYVKMTGESMPGENLSLDGADHDSIAALTHDPGALTSHPRWQRIIIGLAGPFANFIFAIVVMAGFYMLHNEVPLYESQAPTVDWVLPGSPAEAAGIHSGDTIVNFDGQEKPTWEIVDQRIILNLQSVNISHNVALAVLRDNQRVVLNMPLTGILDAKASPDDAFLRTGMLIVMQPNPITVNSVSPGTPSAAAGLQPGDQFLSVDGHLFHGLPSMISYLQYRNGAPLNVELDRSGKKISMTLQPRQEPNPDGTSAWRIGFGSIPPPTRVEQMAFAPAFQASLKFNKSSSLLVVEILKRLFTHRMSVNTLSGPVGIAQQTGMAAETPGWETKFIVLASISIQLGMLNLLPFPILDGGMILFLLIESLIRRDVNIVIKERVYQAAFIIIIVFFVYIMFNDISKLPIFTHTKM